MNTKDLFKLMIEKEASDLYLRTKAQPRARINGKVETIGSNSTCHQRSSVANFVCR